MFDKQDKSGVSPVIGVILMVAVTVALVALVTVTVFDLGGDVSESPDATVQLEEDGGAVTATVLRNENVQDFTLQAETQSSGTSTFSLGGDAGAVQTANPATTTTVTGESDTQDDSGGNIDTSGDKITLNNGDVTSLDDVRQQDNGNSIVGAFSVVDSTNGIIEYDGSEGDVTADHNGIVVDYTHETGSATLTKVSVIANMPDGQSEVLTSTEVNN